MKAFLILLSLCVIFLAFLFRRNAENSPVSTTKDDILFKYFPSHSSFTLRNGKTVPDYFHSYGADLLILHGLSDLELARSSVKGKVYPVEFQGKAYTELWIQKFRDTNIGSFKELLKVYIVSDSEEGARDHGCTHFFCVAFLPMKAGYYLEIHQAWFSDADSKDYKKEFLGYNGGESTSFEFQIKKDKWNFEVKNAQNKALLSGNLNLSSNPLYQLSNVFSFLFRMDRFFNVLLMALHPPVYHPISLITTQPTGGMKVPVVLAFARLTPFFQKPKNGDHLVIEGELKELKFEPLLYEYVNHFKVATGRPVRSIA